MIIRSISKTFVLNIATSYHGNGDAMMLGASISGYPSAPTKTELSQLKELSEAVNALVSRFNEFMREISKLNEILEEHSLKPLKTPKTVSL